MKVLSIVICCLFGICLPGAAQNTLKFKKCVFLTGSDTMHYRLLYPEHYDKRKHYPLVVFLHGDGERGSDNEQQLYAIPKALTNGQGRKKYPCFILAPQCPKNRVWVYFPDFPKSLQATALPAFPARWTFMIIDQLINQLPVDRHRIYLTGYSGGGEGAFDFLTRKPNLFAAAIPLCSVSDTAKASVIKHVPVWVFHGSLDEINDVKYSRMMITNLKKSGGKPRYTEYPGLGHNIVERAYNEPGLFDWLFLQKK